RLGRGSRAVHLPDPTPPPTPAGQTPEETRRAWGVGPARRLAVLFGSLEERKGVLTLLEALLQLPNADARKLSVIIAGRSYDDVRPRLEALAARVHASTSVQLVVREEFIPDGDVQGLIEAADIVLAPYQRHVGSSGIVMRAGAAGKPLLAQDYGLVGHQVRSAGLGWVADTTDPAALARVLAAAATGPPPGFDPARARAFVAPYSEDAYVDALFSNLLGLEPVSPPVPV
ncbi:MAG TPA: glycosyltransferase, partial [Rhodothermales bacterium]|nr:glycosyltransferase [Rhodothermales bacterium]